MYNTCTIPNLPADTNIPFACRGVPASAAKPPDTTCGVVVVVELLSARAEAFTNSREVTIWLRRYSRRNFLCLRLPASLLGSCCTFIYHFVCVLKKTLRNKSHASLHRGLQSPNIRSPRRRLTPVNVTKDAPAESAAKGNSIFDERTTTRLGPRKSRSFTATRKDLTSTQRSLWRSLSLLLDFVT